MSSALNDWSTISSEAAAFITGVSPMVFLLGGLLLAMVVAGLLGRSRHSRGGEGVAGGAGGGGMSGVMAPMRLADTDGRALREWGSAVKEFKLPERRSGATLAEQNEAEAMNRGYDLARDYDMAGRLHSRQREQEAYANLDGFVDTDSEADGWQGWANSIEDEPPPLSVV